MIFERMAAAVGCGSAWAQFYERRNSRNKNGGNYNKGFRVSCVSSTVSDPYKTLSVRPGASESEIKKAFRQLALKVISHSFCLFGCSFHCLCTFSFRNSLRKLSISRCFASERADFGRFTVF